MNWKTEGKILLIIGIVFAAFFFMPIGHARFDNALFEALLLTQWYAREHVVFCLLPAFFIAGAISVFISRQSVMKYLGVTANKVVSYGVASVSGGILAVCSCTILPIFAGIYRMGAGLGPATTFLYSGPAINVMAIVMTANVLGIEIGIARAIGAIVFGIVIGVLMQIIYRKEENGGAAPQMVMPDDGAERKLWQNALFFGLMSAVLIFSTWGNPDSNNYIWHLIYSVKWYLSGAMALGLAGVLYMWFDVNRTRLLITAVAVVALAFIMPDYPMLAFITAIIGLAWITATGGDESKTWAEETWDFAKKIMPLLFYGVIIAGFLLGRPEGHGIVPEHWISSAVGDNGLVSNLLASVIGAFMYFATLTEIPILQGLLGNGMAKGPALALLLAGPALSLPNMLVIKSVIGWRKTATYVTLVIIMATITGLLYGNVM